MILTASWDRYYSLPSTCLHGREFQEGLESARTRNCGWLFLDRSQRWEKRSGTA